MTLTIGQLAKLLGITTKTIRHYHKLGLLPEPARTASGYRLYRPVDLLRLQRIRQFQATGMALRDIALALDARDDEQAVWALIHRLREDIEAQIATLEAQRAAIDTLLREERLSALATLGALPPSLQLLAEHLHGVPVDVVATDHVLIGQMDLLLGKDPAYQTHQQAMAAHIAAHPTAYRELIALSERLVALAQVHEDDPEVQATAQALRAARRSNPLLQWMEQQQLTLSEQHDGFFSELMQLQVNNLLSPAQQRVIQLMMDDEAPI